MKTMELLNLDCTEEENAEIIQKALKRIKPFSNVKGDVELELLEKFIQKITVKYHIMIQWITPTFTNKIESMYSASFKRTDNHVWLGNVYGKTIYELYAKIAIKMYTDVKALDIPEIDWDKVKRERDEKLKELKKEKRGKND